MAAFTLSGISPPSVPLSFVLTDSAKTSCSPAINASNPCCATFAGSFEVFADSATFVSSIPERLKNSVLVAPGFSAVTEIP